MENEHKISNHHRVDYHRTYSFDDDSGGEALTWKLKLLHDPIDNCRIRIRMHFAVSSLIENPGILVPESI